MRERRVVLVLGTRPEAIKLLPVQRALDATPGVRVLVVHTGQHRQLVDQVLGPFGIAPDMDLDLMRDGQPLNALAARALTALDDALARLRADLVIVQGDTTTAMAAALAAFHRGVPVAHVEAGLRSGDRAAPFPEEANRRLIGQLATLHFAPTDGARRNLLREGHRDETIAVTGNTAIDALLLALERAAPATVPPQGTRRRVLVTLHRRESWMHGEGGDGDGCPLDGILAGLAAAVRERPDVSVLFPVHPNPAVRRRVEQHLDGLASVRLVEPMAYLPFVRAMAAADVIVSDSGGVQEEAPSLGVPVLVIRERTERPEGLAPGMNTLVGRDADAVRRALADALDRPRRRPARLPVPNPFGDGRAAERIRDALLGWWRDGALRVAPFVAPPAPHPAPRARRLGGEPR